MDMLLHIISLEKKYYLYTIKYNARTLLHSSDQLSLSAEKIFFSWIDFTVKIELFITVKYFISFNFYF